MAKSVQVIGVGGCDALIWSTPTYHGSVSGSFKKALDWLILLADRKPPYLTNKPVGLVSAADGIQGLQAVNSVDFIGRALRAWSVPLVLPVAESWRTFDSDDRLADEMVGTQMRELGAEVVRAARQFQAEGTCDYADSRQFAQADGEHDARAGRRPPDRGLRPSPGALVSGRPPRPPGPAAPWS